MFRNVYSLELVQTLILLLCRIYRHIKMTISSWGLLSRSDNSFLYPQYECFPFVDYINILEMQFLLEVATEDSSICISATLNSSSLVLFDPRRKLEVGWLFSLLRYCRRYSTLRNAKTSTLTRDSKKFNSLGRNGKHGMPQYMMWVLEGSMFLMR